MTRSPKTAGISARYLVLIRYLEMKTEEMDWHGVSDAANDLREMEAKYPWLRGVRGKAKKR